jgi:hypothetical protein
MFAPFGFHISSIDISFGLPLPLPEGVWAATAEF